LAIRNKWPPEIVRDILRAFPDAGMKKDRDGMYPLHAATRDGNVPSVKAIVEVTPHLARVSTEEDGLPLHVAARHSAPCEVTRHLLETYPEAARTPDSEGELPLHAVCAALGSDELMDETAGGRRHRLPLLARTVRWHS
jgi:ankyrin repeat protein